MAPVKNGEACLLEARLSGHCISRWRGVNEDAPLLSLPRALLSLLPPLTVKIFICPVVKGDTRPQNAIYR